MKSMHRTALSVLLVVGTSAFLGCEKENSTPPAPTASGTTSTGTTSTGTTSTGTSSTGTSSTGTSSTAATSTNATSATKPAPANTATPKDDDHDHKPGEDHDHADDHGHGPTTPLGEQAIGGFTVKASRDGDITPGSDAPIDVWITGGTAKVTTVRFWIGTQDAKGSMKAKAELEKDNWHTHVEIPKPLPAGSKLWVEIESDKGDKTAAGFDLKA